MSARRPLPRWADVALLPALNLLLAFVISGIVVLVIGQNPIDALRIMSMAEIRDAYRAQLRSGDADADSKGAGLGLLTVARDAAGPIEYSLADMPGYENRLLYFYLKATV